MISSTTEIVVVVNDSVSYALPVFDYVVVHSLGAWVLAPASSGAKCASIICWDRTCLLHNHRRHVTTIHINNWTIGFSWDERLDGSSGPLVAFSFREC